MPIHKCSPCGNEFESEEKYLDHQCDQAGGAKPTTPEYLKATTTPNFDAISDAAQARGAEKLS